VTARVLRLVDARTGGVTSLGSPVTRLLIEPGADRVTALRAHVVADVVRRVVEVRKRRAVVTTRGVAVVAAQDLLAWNIAPPDADPDDVDPSARDVVIGVGTDIDQRTRCAVTVGPVRVADPAAGADPLAARLVLLETNHRDAVELSAGALSAAADRLADMRRRVAAWADRPSSAPPPDVVERFLTAVEDDLDLATALGVLDAAAGDPAVPDGAKFELLAYADRVLALDLARDIGRASS